MTEEQRRQNSVSMMKYMSGVFGIVGGYLTAYAAGVAAEESIPFGSAFSSAFGYIKELELLFPINAMSFIGFGLGTLITGGLAYFALKTDSDRNYSYKLDEVAGTGGFMSEKDFQEFEKKYLDPEPESPDEPSPNIILGNKMRRPNDARKMIGNNSTLVVGGAGSGKTRFLIKPNLLNINSSFVITDPSGEIISSLGKVLSNHGYKIKIFNISDMEHSNCYNPLEYVRDDKGVGSVIECLIQNTSDKTAKGGDEFWTKSEKLLYQACISYLLYHCNDKSQKNFATVARMINMAMVDENNPNAKSPLDNIFEAIPKTSLAWTYYSAFKKGAGKTLKSIVISCIARLQPFFTPQVNNLTKRDELELEKVGDEKTALFVITPQADHTYDFLASMLYSQLFETLYYLGEERAKVGKSEASKIPVRCMMDEFSNVGKVPEFPSRLSTMRKYNISAMVILQDISQIEAMYKEEWKTLTGNCSTYVFLGTQEINTLKYFSEMLGKKTVTSRSRGTSMGKSKGSSRNFQQTARDVMTPDELSRMDSSQEIVFMQNQRPMLDSKYRYENHPLYQQTGDAKPENKFHYNQMPAYEVNKAMNINSLLKAQAEASRITEVTNAKSAEKEVIKGNLLEVFNQMTFDADMMRKAKSDIINESVEKVMDTYNAPLSIVKVKSVQPRELYEIASTVATMSGKADVLILSEVKGAPLVGCGVGNHCEKLGSEYLLAREPLGEKACYIALNERAFESYQADVLSHF